MLYLCLGVLGVLNVLLGIIICFSGDGADVGIQCLFGGLICVAIVYFKFLIEKENDKSIKNWIDNKYRYNNLNSNNIKIELKNESNQVIVLANNDRLYYGNETENKFIEIDKNEILKAECNYKTSTKTIKKTIALVGTYKTVNDLIGFELIIVTHSGTYSLFFGKFGININAERAERLALILNDMIENRKINVVENKTTLIDLNNSNEGYCINCGAKVVAKFCGECGTQNYKYNSSSNEA